MRSEIIVPILLSESVIQEKDGGRSENRLGLGHAVIDLTSFDGTCFDSNSAWFRRSCQDET